MGDRNNNLREVSIEELLLRVETALTANERMRGEQKKVAEYLVLGDKDTLAEIDEGFDLRNTVQEIRQRILKDKKK